MDMALGVVMKYFEYGKENRELAYRHRPFGKNDRNCKEKEAGQECFKALL